MSTPIMNRDRVTDHLWEDDAGAAPGPNHFLLATLIHGFNFFQEFWADKRALLQ